MHPKHFSELDESRYEIVHYLMCNTEDIVRLLNCNTQKQ